MTNDRISRDTLCRLLDYNPETGIFKWRSRPREAFKSDGGWKGFQSRCAGKSVGHRDKDGYIRMKVDGKDYFAHRLAWLYVYGDWPEGQIDHINRDKADNRIANLRDVSPAINSRNTPIETRSKTKIPGVHFERHTQKWVAGINVTTSEGIRRKRLGTFSDFHDAVAARKEAESQHGYQ